MLHPVYAKAGQRIEAERLTECHWFQDEDGPWEGSCGACWNLEADGPIENEMNFCPKCGKPIHVVESEPESDATLTPAQDIALLAQPYMPHDKWVELYEVIEKALGEE